MLRSSKFRSIKVVLSSSDRRRHMADSEGNPKSPKANPKKLPPNDPDKPPENP